MITRGQTGGREVGGGRTATAAARVLRWAAAIIGLSIAVLLVAGAWLEITSPEPQARTYSPSEQAQLDAEGRYRALAADARSAAALDPALDPALGERLSAVAADLDAQADAVVLPRSPGPAATSGNGTASATPRPTAGTSSGATAPGLETGVGVDGPRVLSMLRDSALRSLRDAVGAEPGPARVLASAGSNQWRHAVLLGRALGADPGLPPADALSAADLAAGPAAPAPSTGPTPQGSGTPMQEPSATDPGPGRDGAAASGDGTASEGCAPVGPDADRRALLDAREAEDRARYGYEVAAALVPDPAGFLTRSAVHRAAADAAAVRLAELCAPAAPAPAGFTLRPAFRTDPTAALRELEQDHAELYAGLVSVVGPDLRAWAVASYNAAVQRSVEAGTPLAPFPGLRADAVGSPDGASTPEASPAPDDAPVPAGPSGG